MDSTRPWSPRFWGAFTALCGTGPRGRSTTGSGSFAASMASRPVPQVAKALGSSREHRLKDRLMRKLNDVMPRTQDQPRGNSLVLSNRGCGGQTPSRRTWSPSAPGSPRQGYLQCPTPLLFLPAALEERPDIGVLITQLDRGIFVTKGNIHPAGSPVAGWIHQGSCLQPRT